MGLSRQLRFLCIKVRLICDKIGGTVCGGGGKGSSSNHLKTYLVFLVALHESLGAWYVLGELVSVDHVLHVADPGDGVAVVGQEAVHLVRLHQPHLTLISLRREGKKDLCTFSSIWQTLCIIQAFDFLLSYEFLYSMLKARFYPA